MITSIYVNNNNNVETYIANIDLEKLKQLEQRIDISFGKGEPKTYRGRYLKVQGNKKVEILSQKQVGWGLGACDYFYNQNKVPVYLFRFYAYDQHELSKACEYFIKHNNENSQITISQGLKELLSFKPTNKKERKYFYEILSCFNFQKYELDTLVESDIDLDSKKNILSKLKEILIRTKDNEEKHFLPQSYIDIINKQIVQKEYFSSLRKYRTIHYSDDYKNQIKQKRLFSLPEKTQFEKHSLIK